MIKRALLLFSLLLGGVQLSAQLYQWTPTNSPFVTYRYEDVYFLNADTGFGVHYGNTQQFGFIARTVDGGSTWTKVLDSVPYAFRDIGFTDELHGWVGTYENTEVGSDTAVFYKTLDGGLTWSPVDNLPGPQNAGICGLRSINDSTMYGVGRYGGPAGFYKTTNNGITWSYTNLSTLADGLVDIFFFDADTGFAVGNVGTQYWSGYGRILYTTDGGANWSIRYTTIYLNSLCWKVVFPSRNVGYVSMQFFNTVPLYFLKTTNGGLNWQSLPYPGGPSPGGYVQGMGFINDSTGWVGGGTVSYFTEDGGQNWIADSSLRRANRFRFLSDTVAYCAGAAIYRMSFSASGTTEINSRFAIRNYPNPASEYEYFEFFVYNPGRARLSIIDVNGKEVRVLFDTNLGYGNQHYIWQIEGLAAGVYTYRLIHDNHVISEKLIITE